MTVVSTAIANGRLSAVNGTVIRPGTPVRTSTNHPQMIGVFGEANTANQSGLSTNKVRVFSAADAGDRWGYGSNIHRQVSILFPQSGDGIGAIPVYVFAQATPNGSVASVRVWTIVGTASANGIHTAIINGRDGIDSQFYSYSVNIGDTATVIADKIVSAINSVSGTPVIASNTAGVVTFTAKWRGTTSEELDLRFFTNNNLAGLTYTETSTTAGTGSVDLAPSLNQIQETWITHISNPYGEAAFTALENFNGVPDKDNPTGRYEGIVFMPFKAFFGTTLSTVSEIEAITDITARKNQVTNFHAPAPGSEGFTWEAVANMILLDATIADNTPELDVLNRSYPDMPVPANGNIGQFSDYRRRDELVKKGSSTVVLENNAYVVKDLISTYHPDNLPVNVFRYSRSLTIYFNYVFGSNIIRARFIDGHVLVSDQATPDPDKQTVAPKGVQSLFQDYYQDLEDRALLLDASIAYSRLQVGISGENKNRINIVQGLSTTGFGRIVSMDLEIN